MTDVAGAVILTDPNGKMIKLDPVYTGYSTVCHGGFPLTLLTHFAIITNMNRKHRKTLKATLQPSISL